PEKSKEAEASEGSPSPPHPGLLLTVAVHLTIVPGFWLPTVPAEEGHRVHVAGLP
ncbi:MAG: hypothetical protein QOI86_2669, partial [Actinomycetota bacterium]|nr:hypothetical protein [Actinomycetota bacterium]